MKRQSLLVFLCFFLISAPFSKASSHDYKDALSKSILFFEGQRSGHLPPEQRVRWRNDSALKDGSDVGVDLSGGYFDAGDNVKYNFPMAFTTTLLAWSAIEFGDLMPSDELKNTMVAIRWATDYLLKSASKPDKIFIGVGDVNSDHSCWERPEDMDTLRTVYSIDANNPASEVSGEMAAALAASSIVFQSSDSSYSQTLLQTAVRLFQFADTHRGDYSQHPNPQDSYIDPGGYQDELMWGACWLYRASQNQSYLRYVLDNGKNFPDSYAFGWADKHAGVYVLLAKEYLLGHQSSLQLYKEKSDGFMCTMIPDSASPYHIGRTPGGLFYEDEWSNMQHVTTFSFLLVTYASYLSQSNQTVKCGSTSVGPISLQKEAKKQVDYTLGDNPKGLSYMVGYSENCPKRIHHRGASLPSITAHPKFIDCNEGRTYANSPNPDPNVHVGAIVGGPGANDEYEDDRAHYKQSEPTTYMNSGFVGVLAFFTANPNIS